MMIGSSDSLGVAKELRMPRLVTMTACTIDFGCSE